MSLITNFNYRSFESELNRRLVDEKEGISLSLLTSREMERLATVEVRARCGKEMPGAPFRPVIVRGQELPTFWDPRMGNFDVKGFDKVPCATCAKVTSQRTIHPRCEGHYGIIRMPQIGATARDRLVVYNPHTMKDLVALLSAQCFFCHNFRAADWDVVRFECALELLDAGLVGEALHFLEVFAGSKATRLAQTKRLRDAQEDVSIHDTRTLRDYVEKRIRSNYGDAPLPHRSSLYSIIDIRNDVVQQALRELRDFGDGCSRCGGVSPGITERGGQIYIKFNTKALEYNKSTGKLTQQQIDEWAAENQLNRRQRTLLYANSWVAPVKTLCEANDALVGRLFPQVGGATIDIANAHRLEPRSLYRAFFLDCMLVPPLPLRLSSGIQVAGSNISPDDKTRILSQILASAEVIQEFYALHRAGHAQPKQHADNDQNVRNLQLQVNEAYETVLGTFAKKQGLFRMNMMGKRVNQACRSVISPDFTVEPNEVLLPRPFARNLSFPEQLVFVSAARVQFLKQCVLNGATKYPGASHVEVKHDTGRVEVIDLSSTTPKQREIIADKQFALAQSGQVAVTVHRHIINDDRLVFNRQPTLHKCSMMGYRAKVLSGLRTLRFHYVNGKSYNADFDGDEMNVHIPQSLECRAELETIMDANLQYLVPTSGKPLRGLIQDHVAAGVFLTMRDKFFTRDDFVQMLYSGIQSYLGPSDDFGAMIPMPAILLPKPLWTGKQLVSVVCKFVTGVYRGRNGATIRGLAAVPGGAWTSFDKTRASKVDPLGEQNVIFLNSELLVGVLDKNQLGPSAMSLAHVIHEVYGPHAVGRFFGALGRILTYSLQREGFSMGMDDMMMLDPLGRRRELKELDLATQSLDEAAAMGVIIERTTKIQKQFMNSKLLVPFPVNQLIMMTISGAKGSQTNANQMALGLGQQLFDGMRVKRMGSGKTLPCFFEGESRARSFGYAMGRFASGIRPGEYTIHAMAGRDGLIDTAVKTSRSGHLQRCLIKGLESLTVHWDGTVRDSDNSVVQFRYGYDGLDPCRASTITEWNMLKLNVADLSLKYGATLPPQLGGAAAEPTDAAAVSGPGRPTLNENNKRTKSDDYSDDDSSDSDDGELLLPSLPGHVQVSLDNFVRKEGGAAHVNIKKLRRWTDKFRSNPTALRDKIEEADRSVREANRVVMEDITRRKLERARADAGDAVGLLAAQAAGEPSTQMTLNTFHQAGQTVSHVTEGIPRLRELLIHASVKNGAVIVPVKGATANDLLIVNRVLSAVTPIKLLDTMAKIAKPYHFTVQRGPAWTTVNITMLFSRSALNDAKRKMQSGDAEHIRIFSECLKAFARKLSNILRGKQVQRASRSDKEETLGATTDPNAIAGPDADGEDVPPNQDSDSDAEARDDDDVGSRLPSEVPSETPAPKGRRRNIKSGAARGGGGGVSRADVEGADSEEPVSEESDADDDVSSDGGDSETADGAARTKRNKKRGTAAAADDDEEDADEEVTDAPRAGTAAAVSGAHGLVDYRHFPAVTCSYASGKIGIRIAPRETPVPGSAPLLARENAVVVEMNVRMAADFVTVIPDAIAAALDDVTFPSSIPQFENARFMPNKDDASAGELVFHGKGVTLKAVMTALSIIAYDCDAIKINKALSTDIRDMAVTFGIEAAYRALFEELCKLFKRYAVDPRHLTLIADTATHRGEWENYNHTGLVARSSSPLFQMTFASSKRFLTTAVTRGVADDLKSLSAAIMVGERPRVGTATVGCFLDPSILGEVRERHAS